MQLSTKHMINIAGLAAAVVLAASQASAQTATFTLPFTAHVGNATLAPGEYRLQVSGAQTPLPAIYLYHQDKLAATVAVFRQLTNDTEGSYIELANIGGSRYFSKFISTGGGAIYTFAIPHSARHQVLADTRVTKVPASSGASN